MPDDGTVIGHAGGNAAPSGYNAGGGGGAGSAGTDGTTGSTTTCLGNGGAGLAFDITGESRSTQPAAAPAIRAAQVAAAATALADPGLAETAKSRWRAASTGAHGDNRALTARALAAVEADRALLALAARAAMAS